MYPLVIHRVLRLRFQYIINSRLKENAFQLFDRAVNIDLSNYLLHHSLFEQEAGLDIYR